MLGHASQKSKHYFLDCQLMPAYNRPMKQKAPISAETPTGARIRTVEAERTRQAHYPAFGCGSQEEIHHDLPQLPDRM
jgi:hypothetical protein